MVVVEFLPLLLEEKNECKVPRGGLVNGRTKRPGRGTDDGGLGSVRFEEGIRPW